MFLNVNKREIGDSTKLWKINAQNKVNKKAGGNARRRP